MRYEDLNWFDVENYLETDDRLMIVFGSCEQHAHLSLLTDVKIPLSLADAASKESNVLVAPVVNFGVSPYFLAYPGTISLRVKTLLDVAEDIIRSVYRQGFRRLLVLNGHGGNDPLKERFYELANQLELLQVRWYAWFQSHSVLDIAIKNDLKPAHANWVEAFPFTQIGELPAVDKRPLEVPSMLSSRETRELFGDGSFGGPYAVSQNIMQEIFDSALLDILQLLKFD
jgi:creatinine amidohydrolase